MQAAESSPPTRTVGPVEFGESVPPELDKSELKRQILGCKDEAVLYVWLHGIGHGTTRAKAGLIAKAGFDEQLCHRTLYSAGDSLTPDGVDSIQYSVDSFS